MSSSLSRNSNVRKSFRLEITLEKSYVETSRSPDSLEDALKLDSPSSPKREFKSTRNWNSDPKLLSKEHTSSVTTKSSSSGNLTRSKAQSKAKKDKNQSKNTMNYAGNASGTDTQKSKPGPVSRLKTVIRSTKETIVERLPGSSRESSKRVSRSRPKSVDASQRFGVHSNGKLNQREPSLSPPLQRKSKAKVDRSRSFNVKSRVNIDGFVAKRCEVWERKSRDSSPNRSTFLPVDLPSTEVDKKSLIKQRTAMLLESKTPENTLPSKKQLLLDLNGRTPSKGSSKTVPQKPQLKPKRVNLFKRGEPVKPNADVHLSVSDNEPLVSNSSSVVSVELATKNQSAMGKTCSVHQEGSVIEEDYGIDALKAGYDPHSLLNSVTTSPIHQRKEKVADRRLGKDEKENQSDVLPKNQRTTKYSPGISDSVQSNGPLLSSRVLTERLDENLLNYNLTENPTEKIVVKQQTVATLNGVKLLDDAVENKGDSVDKKSILMTNNIKMTEDDVFESPEDNKQETLATVNGVVLAEKEPEKDGYYFLDVTSRTQEELENLSKRAEQDLESDIPEEASGKLRAAIGKTNLLTTKKFKQFRGLCDENNHPLEGSKTPTSEDLAGFWDMVMIQVDDVKTMFEEIEGMRRNGWQSPKRASQVKLPEVKTPTKRLKTKTRPKASTPNTKTSLKETERVAKAKQQREEARRRLLAAKKAMRRRTLSGSISDEGGVEIYC